MTSRTLPVVASATRNVARLWSREDETKASWVASELHSTSANGPSHSTSSHSEERCGSGCICSRMGRLASTSMMTRCISKILVSPGRGYFHVSSVGWPTAVCTRYISPTPRPSCWNVAIFLESGDQRRTGRSLRVQPALSVAYPKSFTPSSVSCVSLPEVISRIHKLKSRMNAARLPSGERILFGGCEARLAVTHLAPRTSQVQFRLPALKVMLRPLSSKLKVVKGSRNGSYLVPEAEESASATFT